MVQCLFSWMLALLVINLLLTEKQLDHRFGVCWTCLSAMRCRTKKQKWSRIPWPLSKMPSLTYSLKQKHWWVWCLLKLSWKRNMHTSLLNNEKTLVGLMCALALLKWKMHISLSNNDCFSRCPCQIVNVWHVSKYKAMHIDKFHLLYIFMPVLLMYTKFQGHSSIGKVKLSVVYFGKLLFDQTLYVCDVH